MIYSATDYWYPPDKPMTGYLSIHIRGYGGAAQTPHTPGIVRGARMEQAR